MNKTEINSINEEENENTKQENKKPIVTTANGASNTIPISIPTFHGNEEDSYNGTFEKYIAALERYAAAAEKHDNEHMNWVIDCTTDGYAKEFIGILRIMPDTSKDAKNWEYLKSKLEGKWRTKLSCAERVKCLREMRQLPQESAENFYIRCQSSTVKIMNTRIVHPGQWKDTFDELSKLFFLWGLEIKTRNHVYVAARDEDIEKCVKAAADYENGMKIRNDKRNTLIAEIDEMIDEEDIEAISKKIGRKKKENNMDTKKEKKEKKKKKDLSHIRCFGCGEMGHYKSMCPNEEEREEKPKLKKKFAPAPKKVEQLEEEEEDSDDFLDELDFEISEERINKELKKRINKIKRLN